MKPQLVFATNNAHKLGEIRAITGDKLDILSLDDIGCHEDIAETADTLAGNALIKARYVADRYEVDCFADDTGLEVNALCGEPGVHTARYAAIVTGKPVDHDSEANINVLLDKLDGCNDRSARFVTVIAMAGSYGEHLVEGVCEGSIATQRSGNEGFGYDPIFIPNQTAPLTFAQLSADQKNRLSHRGRATKAFLDLLKSHGIIQ